MLTNMQEDPIFYLHLQINLKLVMKRQFTEKNCMCWPYNLQMLQFQQVLDLMYLLCLRLINSNAKFVAKI